MSRLLMESASGDSGLFDSSIPGRRWVLPCSVCAGLQIYGAPKILGASVLSSSVYNCFPLYAFFRCVCYLVAKYVCCALSVVEEGASTLTVATSLWATSRHVHHRSLKVKRSQVFCACIRIYFQPL